MSESRSEHSVLIKIRNQDPRSVCAKTLTSQSSVFSQLINDLGLSVLEVEDFQPEVVLLFLTALGDKSLGDIEDVMFRELHKLAVVFKVGWLVAQCRNWLYIKIEQINPSLEYSLQLFLFEESRFIARKWDIKRPINLLIYKLAMVDNSCFILRYVENLSDLNTVQLDYLLKLAGTNNSIFIDIIDRDLETQRAMSKNLRYLFENINFDQKHGLQQEQRLYGKIFEKIANLPEITKEDLRLVLKKSAGYSKNKVSPDQDVIISYSGDYVKQYPKYLYELIDFVNEHCPNKFDMMMVVDLLLIVISPDDEQSLTYTTSEVETFIKQLTDLPQGKEMKLVSVQYINMIISILQQSGERNKDYVIKILEIIRENDTLSSYTNFLQIPVSHIAPLKRFPLRSSFSSSRTVLPECTREGECGFRITRNISVLRVMENTNAGPALHPFLGILVNLPLALRFLGLNRLIRVLSCSGARNRAPINITSWILSTGTLDYRNNTGTHYHEFFSAEDMRLYKVQSVTLKNGGQLSLPSPLWEDYIEKVWRNWLPDFRVPKIGRNKNEAFFVDYCIKKFLVAKN